MHVSGIMAEFALEVTTANVTYAGTFDSLYVTLIGSDASSEHTHLTSVELDNETGKVSSRCFQINYKLNLKFL